MLTVFKDFYNDHKRYKCFDLSAGVSRVFLKYTIFPFNKLLQK